MFSFKSLQLQRVSIGLFSVFAALSFVTTLSAQTEFRGLWVDAWGPGFLSTNQITKLVEDCRTYNFNAVVVQMRRRGDAFYLPQLPNEEPRTKALAVDFDALQEIINQCHSGPKRIEVHC